MPFPLDPLVDPQTPLVVHAAPRHRRREERRRIVVVGVAGLASPVGQTLRIAIPVWRSVVRFPDRVTSILVVPS